MDPPGWLWEHFDRRSGIGSDRVDPGDRIGTNVGNPDVLVWAGIQARDATQDGRIEISML
jgi:hypothetical protein